MRYLEDRGGAAGSWPGHNSGQAGSAAATRQPPRDTPHNISNSVVFPSHKSIKPFSSGQLECATQKDIAGQLGRNFIWWHKSWSTVFESKELIRSFHKTSNLPLKILCWIRKYETAIVFTVCSPKSYSLYISDLIVIWGQHTSNQMAQMTNTAE